MALHYLIYSLGTVSSSVSVLLSVSVFFNHSAKWKTIAAQLIIFFFFYRWRNLRQKRVTCSNQHSNSPREFQKDSVSPEQNDFVEPSVRQLQRWFAKVQCCWNHFDCSRSQSGFR